MKGRKPTPTALHVLRGNPGRRRRNADEPTPAVQPDLIPPEWIDEEAKAEWRRLAPILGRLGVLTETDAEALTAYCEAWATWKGATQKIRQFGMVIKGKQDNDLPTISPYVRIADRTLTQMRALLVEFGMTPSSRTRVHAAKPVGTPVSKWEGALS